MAEIEQASLKSEQLSDKSSPPALPDQDQDQVSLDETTAFPLICPDPQGGFSSDSPSSEDDEGGRLQCTQVVIQSQVQSQVQGQVQSQVQVQGQVQPCIELETDLQECEIPTSEALMISPQGSPGGVSSCSNKDKGSEGGASSSGFWPLLHLPSEFFHPAAPAGPPRSRSLRLTRGLRLTSPRSWASMRSPGARSKKLCTQYPSHSDSSLATGSSEGSLQTTLEEGLSFSVSPPQVSECPLPSAALVCPVPQPRDTVLSSPVQSLRPRPTPSSVLTLQAIRGHQRSQSSGRGSTSPGYTREDSMDPSDEDLGIVLGPSSQAGNSEHLSEALSSLSLTSLLAPSALLFPSAAVKKCSSTGSLEPAGLLLSRGSLDHTWPDSQRAEPGLRGKSCSQTAVGPRRKDR